MTARRDHEDKQAEREYRVFRLSSDQRKAIREGRRRLGLSIGDLMKIVVLKSLPEIVQTLQELGFEPQERGAAIRWPITEPQMHILNIASHRTGIPMNTLLVLAVMRALKEDTPKPTRRRSRRKSKS